MTIHVLKCDASYWEDINMSKKPFEVRKDDREPAFKSDDLVVLVHSDPGPRYGHWIARRIGYLARGGRIPDGYCVFELKSSKEGDTARAEVALEAHKVSRHIEAKP